MRYLLPLLLFASTAVAQTPPPTLDDVWRECRDHMAKTTPAVVAPGQQGSFELGYEGCNKVLFVWRNTPEGQRATLAQQALRAGGADAISQFVKDNNIGQ